MIHNSKGYIEEQSNTSQVIESESISCNFWYALIALVIGLFHGIRFIYPTNSGSRAAHRFQVGPYFTNLVDMCSTNKINEDRKKKEHKKAIFSFWKILLIILVLTEEMGTRQFPPGQLLPRIIAPEHLLPGQLAPAQFRPRKIVPDSCTWTISS